ncbi:LmbU family transcriptional regulator [Actinomadura sp. ATCC 31491]|uniref:LmbU family transcriptional regulator n=1 Tax=Actinomadura luzonensis TaxID=2805427 RepID=A0ABT0FW78_9ACTN|nr:LmbU family transcriptional regulator [Actinomadura luzonensis]MCK2216181.1 LmbU family transcriptional regulator [Actinomadura luzonensis]UKU09932.1 Luz12 [Actinomadura luzonensis]
MSAAVNRQTRPGLASGVRAGAPGEQGAVRGRLGIDAGVYAGRVELRIPVGLGFESWCRIGQQIRRISDSSCWWLADWLVYGEEQFPGRYQVVCEETSLSYQTLRNYAWVARKFPPSRRRDSLSLQHHAEAASLPEAEQDLWLARAERESWSARRLRQELRKRARKLDEADPATRVQVTLSLDSERRDRWMQASEAAHMPFMDWIVRIIDDASGDRNAPDRKTA